jgi:hypothetical protein
MCALLEDVASSAHELGSKMCALLEDVASSAHELGSKICALLEDVASNAHISLPSSPDPNSYKQDITPLAVTRSLLS